MRRKSTYLVYSAAIGILIVLIIYYLYLRRRGLDLLKADDRKQVDLPELLNLILLGGLVGGLVGNLKYYYEREQESKYPFCSEKYLTDVLQQESLSSEPDLLKKINELKEEIKSQLYYQFGSALAAPIKETGSFSLNTAVISDFDVDIIIFFKKESFNSLEEMYYSVYNFLKNQFPDAEVVRQNKTIGLNFYINDAAIHFDIVPGRQINKFCKSGEANLFRKGTWFFDKSGSFKTKINFNNPPKYNSKVAGIIKLAKTYRIKNNLNLPSIVIEESATEWSRFENRLYTNSISKNFLSYLNYLQKLLHREWYKDPKNSNNNLIKKMTTSDRENIISLIRNDIEMISIDPRELPEIFLNNY